MRSTALLLFLSFAVSLRAEVGSKTVEYKHDATTLEGVLLVDSAVGVKRPGVLFAHPEPASADGRAKAAQFARFGYVVFSADLFGKGTSPKDTRAALGLTGKDRTLVRGRIAAALAVLAKQPQVDPKRIAAVGYGVGGTAVLELARTGADLEAVACLHGDLSAIGDDAKKIGAAVLAIVGSDDPAITLTQVGSFEDEMRKGGVDSQIVRYGGVAGDFTNPRAGKDLKSGRAFDADADRRSTEAIRLFLAEHLPATKPVAVVPKAAPASKDVPDKVLKVLKHVDEHGAALDGYEGGRTFGNFEKRLPQSDRDGRRIKYREWDVNPLRTGVNRGAERLVTGSDGSAHYTSDHYDSFKKIR